MRGPGLVLMVCCVLALMVPLAASRAGAQESKRSRVETNLLPCHAIVGEEPYTLAERMDHYGVPGVSIAVIEDFEVVWTSSYGVVDAASGTPVTDTTMFCVGSVTKAVTAAMVLSLAADGLVDLDGDIDEQLTGWSVPPNDFTRERKVTPRRLLNHSGGIMFSPPYSYAADAFPTAIQILRGESPARSPQVTVDAVPGERFLYSNAGFTAARLLIEERSGMSYADCAAARIFEPLGMKHSTLDVPPPDGVLPGAAIGHDRNGPLPRGSAHWVGHTAAGGLYTTAADYAAFVVELQRSFHGRSDRILPQGLVEEMISPHDAANYGLGVFLHDRGRGEQHFSHIGDARGFVAGYTSHRTAGHGAVILTNGQGGINLVREIFRGIATVHEWPGYVDPPIAALALDDAELEALAGRYRLGCDEAIEIRRDGDGLTIEAPDLPGFRLYAAAPGTLVCRERGGELVAVRDGGGVAELRIGLSDEIGRPRAEPGSATRMGDDELTPLEMLLAGDIDGALAAYEAWRADHPDDPQVSSRRFNSVGYRMLAAERTDDAVAVFRMAMLLYPDEANAFDSLGEGLAAQGKTGEAIAAFERALEIDPEFDHAAEQIELLRGQE